MMPKPLAQQGAARCRDKQDTMSPNGHTHTEAHTTSNKNCCGRHETPAQKRWATQFWLVFLDHLIPFGGRGEGPQPSPLQAELLTTREVVHLHFLYFFQTSDNTGPVLR